MSTRNNDPTNGRVYGGDTGLIHIADGERVAMGVNVAAFLDEAMREAAFADGRRTLEEVDQQNLCAGCYMVALFNCAVELANQNGQSLQELGRAMGEAFTELGKKPGADDVYIESITIRLDSHEERTFYAQYSVMQMIGMGF